MKHFDIYPESLRDRPLSQSLSEEPTIHDGCIIVDSDIGAWTEIGRNTLMMESSFGDYSYTAGDVDMIYTEVGKFCSIAARVRINPGNHPMERVTQHHMTYRRKAFGFAETDDAEFFEWRRAHRCVIGHDVWVGHGAIIMPGVSIGAGAVIGSGAVVTKNVEPYQIVVGIPAHPVRKRFSDDIIAQLLQIAWWDWDRQTLEARFDDFYNMDIFIEKYGSKQLPANTLSEDRQDRQRLAE
jgi:phosphonate metabolism protein (transferase hexapeptide repeat family)